jgi:hypothetical protein
MLRMLCCHDTGHNCHGTSFPRDEGAEYRNFLYQAIHNAWYNAGLRFLLEGALQTGPAFSSVNQSTETDTYLEGKVLGLGRHALRYGFLIILDGSFAKA